MLFRQLPLDQVKAVPMWSHCAEFRADLTSVPVNALLAVPGGRVTAGKSEATQETYGWDLEYGTLDTEVGGFRASKYLCSNGEFLAFVRAGGYDDPTLWGDEGWKFVQFRKAQAPVFWVPVSESESEPEPQQQQSTSEVPNKDGSAALTAGQDKVGPAARAPVTYRYRTMTAVIDMPWDWPVDCNYIEAKAFCAWKNRQRAAAAAAAAAAGAPAGTATEEDGWEIRMPSEAEYLRFREYAFPTVDPETGVKNDQPYWTSAPGNLNLEHGASSCPIDKFAFDHGFFDVVGNVWQWTETPIMPLRGFKFHPLYDDFSVPTFDTRHNLFYGGSWASTGNEATRAARYAFRRHFYQHAGFRYILARPLAAQATHAAAMCETDPAVTLMMDAQFNDTSAAKVARALGLSADLPNYSKRLAELAVGAYKTHGRTVHAAAVEAPAAEPVSTTAAVAAGADASPAPTTTSLLGSGPRAVDLGCACGRSTFEIAKLSAPSATDPSGSASRPLFDHILGLDFSTRFIRIAARLQFDQHAEYSMKKEGELTSYHAIESQRAEVPSSSSASSSTSPQSDSSASAAASSLVASDSTTTVLDLDLASRGMQSRVEFMQADACNLGSKYTGFDLVLAGNLIDYLYEPRLFLRSIGDRMRRGAILVLSSSYSWDEAYTPKAHWLGGVKDAGGESVDSSRAIGDLLASEFDALPAATVDLPMVWKQNARNYQIKFAHTTFWRKR